MLKREQINIRDPFVLVNEDRYYLYGTRSATTWGEAFGLDCYVSDNLEDWDEPIEIYSRCPDSPYVCCYWAPECYRIEKKFHLITTLGKAGNRTGIFALHADTPTGPFRDEIRLTPEDWRCIDGTLYTDDSGTYLAFSRSFEDYPDGGDLWGVRIRVEKDEIIGPEGEPFRLFEAKEAGWNEPIPFAKEFGIDGIVYLSDGPFMVKNSKGELVMLWSSWCKGSYAVGAAVSESGRITGPYRHEQTTLVPGNAGHGMAFTARNGEKYYALHYPNDRYKEAPVFYPLLEEDGQLIIEVPL